MNGPVPAPPAGPLLAVETATDLVGAAVLLPSGALVERVHEGGRAHGELLAPSIGEACAAAGVTVGELVVVAVDVGPGRFTGLRVGVATAKALAQGLGVGVVGVSSLDVLAAGARADLGPVAVAAVVDARRGEVFAAGYPVAGADDPADGREDRAAPMSPGELVGWLGGLADRTGRLVVVGDGALRYRDVLAADPRLDAGPAEAHASPRPGPLARLAAARLAAGAPVVAPADLVPEYRRPADATVNWEQRAPRTPT